MVCATGRQPVHCSPQLLTPTPPPPRLVMVMFQKVEALPTRVRAVKMWSRVPRGHAGAVECEKVGAVECEKDDLHCYKPSDLGGFFKPNGCFFKKFNLLNPNKHLYYVTFQIYFFI